MSSLPVHSQMGMIPMHDERLAEDSIQPLEFKIKYKPVMEYVEVGGRSIARDTGQLRAEEWVEWAKKGVTIPRTVCERVDKLKKAAEKATEPDDEAADKWRAIKPFYENWKSGGTVEIVNGTPLAIWAAISKDVVETLKAFKIYSVEDLSMASDNVLQRIPDPNIMRYRERAKKYLQTKDFAIAIREMDHKDEMLEALKAQVAELQKAHADSEFKRKDTQEKLDAEEPAAKLRRGKRAEAA
jgi:hypothetical protein